MTKSKDNQKLTTVLTKLNWSHIVKVLSLNDTKKIAFYVNIAADQGLSVRELEKKIKSKEYERLDSNTIDKIINKEIIDIRDLVPNPILIRNNSNADVVNEKILHNLIMEDIPSFLKELGSGYSFIDSEFKIKIDDRYNYIDFLLYNIKFRCYVVIELKVTEFKTEYIG